MCGGCTHWHNVAYQARANFIYIIAVNNYFQNLPFISCAPEWRLGLVPEPLPGTEGRQQKGTDVVVDFVADTRIIVTSSEMRQQIGVSA